jgi:methionyl-tRNA formyltransferase
MAVLKIVFFGTAELACASLAALAQQPEWNLLAVVTRPDRPKGRHLQPQPSPVKSVALRLGLPVLEPERARDPRFVDAFRRLAPDLGVVAAYGQLLPPALLGVPPHGFVNVHTSLLPRYRGAAPIQWALLDDQSETGVTIMKLDAGLDTGDILAQRTTPIHAEDDAESLHDRLAQMGAELLVQTIPDYVAGRVRPRPQDETGASYARKITKEDGHLDWSRPARELWNRVRAFRPWPGAFSFLPGPSKSKLLKLCQCEVVSGRSGPAGQVLEAGPQGVLIGCGREALRVTALQLEGGRRLSAAEFLAGHPLAAGVRLG